MNTIKDHADSAPKKIDTESPLYRIDRLINLSIMSNFLAWFILILTIIHFVATARNLWTGYFSPSFIDLNYGYIYDFTYYLASFFPSIVGLFLFIILRFAAEGVLLFIDIETNLRELREKKE